MTYILTHDKLPNYIKCSTTVASPSYNYITIGTKEYKMPSAITVVDNTGSTSTTSVLSANQGKVLNARFANYLPLTGGTVTGNVNVTGTITLSTGKVPLTEADIVNNLSSTSTTTPLSAAQGTNINNKFASYLPLAGGTMTGTLKLASGFEKSGNTSYIRLYGGTSYSGGATIALTGGGMSGWAGKMEIGAYDGTNRRSIEICRNKFTWNGSDILCLGWNYFHRYLHKFVLYDSTTSYAAGSFIDSNSSAYTTNTALAKALYDAGYKSADTPLATWSLASSTTQKNIYVSVYGNSSGNVYYYKVNGQAYSNGSWNGMTDVVTQIS